MPTLVEQKTQKSITQEEKDSLVLMAMLKAIGQAKISKDPKDSELHPLFDAALAEVKRQRLEVQDYVMEVFLRNIFYVFSVQRQHNIWKQQGIKSDVIGAQMRKTGRSLVRWLAKNMSSWLYARDNDGYLYNLNLLVEYANYDLLTHNMITTKTSKGATGKMGTKKVPNRIVGYETMNLNPEYVTELIVQNYRKNNGRSLIARWLPRFNNSEIRYQKLVVGKDYKAGKFNCSGKDRVKLNGKVVTGTVSVVNGDVLIYTRKIQAQTKERINKDNALVYSICKALDWNVAQYNKFRHTYMQRTPEHLFSTGKIKNFTKDQFMDWINTLSAGQIWVVSSTLCYKNKLGALDVRPNTNWSSTQLPTWYILWSSMQDAKAGEIRQAMASGDRLQVKQLEKQLKVKSTGLQTVDILAELAKGKKAESELNTLHTSLISKMFGDMVVPAYCIIDGSGSMDDPININGTSVRMIDIAICLAVTFMITNPVKELGESCMWFGSEASFTGVTKYKNSAPNSFVTGAKFQQTTQPRKLVDAAWPFTENFRSLYQANPRHVKHTNVGQTVQTFMKLVQENKMAVEDLPKVLIYITDEEYNTGLPAVQGGQGFTEIPRSIGWNPLFVFWGLETTRGFDMYEKAPNCLVTRGFSENNISQILQFIRKGAINIYDELHAVAEMPGLQPVKYS